MRSPSGSASFTLALAATLSLARPALADRGAPTEAPRAEAASRSVVVRGKEQDALAVGIAGGKLVAHVCPAPKGKGEAPDCDPTGQTTLVPPSSLKGGLESAELRKVRTSQGRELVLVSATAPDARRWVALLVADDGAPRVVWSGYTSSRTDEPGNELTSKKDGGGEKLGLVRRVSLCGKTVTASTAELDPKSLELVARPADDPVADARKTAVKVAAKKLPTAPKVLDLLYAPRASSGVADRLVDGDPASPWVEDAPGTGTFELVSLSAPDSVPVTGFDLSFAPPAGIPGARAPKSVLVVTRDKAFSVELPDDPTENGGAYAVELAEPIHTSCVGLVLGEAFPDKAPAKGDAKADKPAKGDGRAATKVDPHVFVGELSLRTRYEGLTLDDLASSLSGGGDEARARADVLGVARSAGVEAAIRAYPKLDPRGRDLARRVIDAADCDEKLALYVPLLEEKDEEELGRAHDRVRRCGKDAAPLLLEKLRSSEGAARAAYAEELALLSPDVAMPALVAGLSAAKSADERLLFRRAMVKAAERDSSVRAFERALAPESFDGLPLDARIDVLRAAGPRLGETQRGAAAFSAVAREATDFRGRFLLVGPAASLARAGNHDAEKALAEALVKDPDGRIRTRAAEMARAVPSFTPLLVGAAADPAVRVREAAARSLEGQNLEAKTQGKLAKGLVDEPWTFVRRALVQSIGGMRGDAAVDASLAFALEHEEQPAVRRDLLVALGARGATSQRQAIKDRADDTGEAIDVRVEAVTALGKICDKESIPELVRWAAKGATPFYEADRKLAVAATGALGRLHPKDLAARLAPLTGDKVPGDVQDAARAALAEKNVCR
jgi:hypothetical protein